MQVGHREVKELGHSSPVSIGDDFSVNIDVVQDAFNVNEVVDEVPCGMVEGIDTACVISDVNDSVPVSSLDKFRNDKDGVGLLDGKLKLLNLRKSKRFQGNNNNVLGGNVDSEDFLNKHKRDNTDQSAFNDENESLYPETKNIIENDVSAQKDLSIPTDDNRKQFKEVNSANIPNNFQLKDKIEVVTDLESQSENSKDKSDESKIPNNIFPKKDDYVGLENKEVKISFTSAKLNKLISSKTKTMDNKIEKIYKDTESVDTKELNISVSLNISTPSAASVENIVTEESVIGENKENVIKSYLLQKKLGFVKKKSRDPM